MNSMRRLRSLLQSFHTSLWIRVFPTAVILLTLLISLATSQASAGNASVIIGPQIDIFRGVRDQLALPRVPSISSWEYFLLSLATTSMGMVS